MSPETLHELALYAQIGAFALATLGFLAACGKIAFAAGAMSRNIKILADQIPLLHAAIAAKGAEFTEIRADMAEIRVDVSNMKGQMAARFGA